MPVILSILAFCCILFHNTPVLIAQQVAMSPEEAYKSYLDSIKNSDIEQYKEFLSGALLDKVNSDPETTKNFQEMSHKLPKNVKITFVKLLGNRAILATSGDIKIGKGKGTVIMVLEDGSWKLQSEMWKSSKP